MSENRLLRLPTVISRLGISRASIYRLIEAGKIPTPVKIGKRAVAWRSADIDRIVQEGIGA